MENEQEVENDVDTWEDISYDDAVHWKQKADRLDKAEKKVVELKRQLKDKEATNNKATDSSYITREEAEMDKFIDNNPDLTDYKENLSKYRKDWLSLTQAKLLVESDDKTIENRRKSNSMQMTDWEVTWKTSYSKKELEKLPQREFNRVIDAVNAGKIDIS